MKEDKRYSTKGTYRLFVNGSGGCEELEIKANSLKEAKKLAEEYLRYECTIELVDPAGRIHARYFEKWPWDGHYKWCHTPWSVA